MSLPPILLKPAEVCERLNISPVTMHKLIKNGDLRAVRFGPKSTRVYADSVERLIEKGAQNA